VQYVRQDLLELLISHFVREDNVSLRNGVVGAKLSYVHP
jgi:hypothetical protein